MITLPTTNILYHPPPHPPPNISLPHTHHPIPSSTTSTTLLYAILTHSHYHTPSSPTPSALHQILPITHSHHPKIYNLHRTYPHPPSCTSFTHTHHLTPYIVLPHQPTPSSPTPTTNTVLTHTHTHHPHHATPSFPIVPHTISSILFFVFFDSNTSF